MNDDEKLFYKKIGNAIKNWRYEHKGKMTQKDLANLMKVTPNTVSRWETGTYAISLYDLSRLEFFFGSSLHLESFLLDNPNLK